MRKVPVLHFSIALLTMLVLRAASADPLAELSSFSVFDKVDLAALAKGDPKTAHGQPMSNPRYLSVQSCYVAPGAPSQHLEALRSWNPAPHRELKVILHFDVPGSPTESAFAKIKSAPDIAPVRAFVAATTKMSPDLQLSRDEAAKWKGGEGALNGTMGDFWMSVLAGRARAFVSGGTSALPPYDHAGSPVRAGDELNGLLREQGKIRKQFSGFLESTGIGRGAASLRPELYWEMLNVDDVAAVALGGFYSRPSGSAAQAADTFYYASGGFYAGLTLYQMWPVDIGGRASTLVWRGDMIASASLASLHGVEKLASESAMMKDVAKSITVFRKESAR
ncbi:MAG TPA: hypothetical protein VGH08_07600 [Chthoniobacterales bacterium]|jgi:hypothetical protein